MLQQFDGNKIKPEILNRRKARVIFSFLFFLFYLYIYIYFFIAVVFFK
jgi:hypothetical protein